MCLSALLLASYTLNICSTLKMEALRSSETSVKLYQNIRHHILKIILFIVTAVRNTTLAKQILLLVVSDFESRQQQRDLHLNRFSRMKPTRYTHLFPGFLCPHLVDWLPRRLASSRVRQSITRLQLAVARAILPFLKKNPEGRVERLLTPKSWARSQFLQKNQKQFLLFTRSRSTACLLLVRGPEQSNPRSAVS
jgi:hypothetical protein